MNIRRARIDDAQRVLQFLQEFRAEGLDTVLRHETLPSLDDEQAFIRKLNAEAGVMFLADVDGEPSLGISSVMSPACVKL